MCLLALLLFSQLDCSLSVMDSTMPLIQFESLVSRFQSHYLLFIGCALQLHQVIEEFITIKSVLIILISLILFSSIILLFLLSSI